MMINNDTNICIKNSFINTDLLIIDNQNASQYLNMSMRNFTNLQRVVFFSQLSSLPTGYFENHRVIKEIYFPKSLLCISDRLFRNSSITKIFWYNNITSLGNRSFYNCNELQHISMPKKLQVIGEKCFANSAIKEIYFQPFIKNIGNYAFENSKLKHVEISINSLQLGNGIFHRCYELENAIISSDIITVPEFTFNSCINLKHVEIHSKKLKSIELDAFTNCPNLYSVDIYGSNNINIHKDAFSDDVNYKQIIHYF